MDRKERVAFLVEHFGNPRHKGVLEGADVAWLERRWREARSPRALRKLVERLLGVAAARRPARLN